MSTFIFEKSLSLSHSSNLVSKASLSSMMMISLPLTFRYEVSFVGVGVAVLSGFCANDVAVSIVRAKIKFKTFIISDFKGYFVSMTGRLEISYSMGMFFCFLLPVEGCWRNLY